eukprot:jgi/Botrbrau1/5990/Bobra.104_1s0021.1
MPIEISGLWWPVLSRMYNKLSAVVHGGAKVDEALEKELKSQQALLVKGINWFKAPSAQSRDALTKETFFVVGEGRKLPVEKQSLAAALETSLMLGLDEIQSYILVRRLFLSVGNSGSGSSLTASQRLLVLSSYWQDRMYLLKIVEMLLMNAYGRGLGPRNEALLKIVQPLLDSQNLKGGLYSQLLSNLDHLDQSGLVPVPQRIVPGNATAAPATAREGGAAQGLAELGALLDSLLLIFSFENQSCSQERYRQLLMVLRGVLAHSLTIPERFLASGVLPAVMAADLRRAQLLGALLLIQTLSLEKTLRSLSEGEQQGKAPAAASLKSLGELSEVLKRYWEDRAPAEAPVLLAWAAYHAVALGAAGDASKAEALVHAQQAEGGLACLPWLASVVKGASQLDPVYRSILRLFLATVITVFRVSPYSVKPADFCYLQPMVEAIYSGSASMCNQLWTEPTLEDMPILAALDEARFQYPALPVPLLTLLAALVADARSAHAAAAYFGNIDHVTTLHCIDDDEVDIDDTARNAWALEEIPVRGNDWISIPKGTHGLVIHVPPFTAEDRAARGYEDVDLNTDMLLVKWDLNAPPNQGWYLFQGRVAHCTSLLVEKFNEPATWWATTEVGASMALLAKLGSFNPEVAFHIFQLIYRLRPGATAALALNALDALCREPDPSLLALGNCLLVVKDIAGILPAFVLQTLEQTQLLRPAVLLLSSGMPMTSECRLSAFITLNQEMEGKQGQYPVCIAFLELLTVLAEAGLSSPALKAYVYHVISYVLPNSPGWRYTRRSQRWEVASAGLRVLSAALEMLPSPAAVQQGVGNRELADDIIKTLGFPGAMESLLFGSLPPDAWKLEGLQEATLVTEVAAAESAVLEWYRFIPLLLAAGPPSLALPFFQARSPTQPTAAQTLASYLTFSPLEARQRAQGFQALAALVDGCGRAARPLSSSDFYLPTPSNPDERRWDVRERLRDVFLEALQYETVAKEPDVFCPAVRLLEVAFSGCPGLADELMFFEDSDEPPEDPEEALQTVPDSAVSGLCMALSRAGELRINQPRSLACLLRVLLVLWQSGATAFRGLQAIRRRRGFWEAVALCLPDPADTAGVREVPKGSDTEAWSDAEAEIWRLAAEASALSLISLEALSFPPNKSSPPSMVWKVLAGWDKEPYREYWCGLLQRYAGPCRGVPLLERALSDAAAAAAELVNSVLLDEEVGVAFRAPGGFMEALASRVPGGVLRTGGPRQVTAEEMRQAGAGQLLLAGGHVPYPREGYVQYGAGHPYNASVLARRCCGIIAPHLACLGRFFQTLGALSVLAGYEEARMGALRAFHAALFSASFEPKRTEALQTAWEALEGTLLPFMTSLTAGHFPFQDFVISPAHVTYEACMHVAKCATFMVREWERGDPESPRARPRQEQALTLASSILELCRQWLAMERTPAAETLDPNPSELTGTLLSACIMALRQVRGAGAQTLRGAALGFQETLALMVVPLAELCQRPGPNQASGMSLLLQTSHAVLLPPRVWLQAVDQARLNLVNLVEAGVEVAGSWLQGALSTCPPPPPALSPAFTRSIAVIDSALLLLLQVAQTQAGALLLAEQGVMVCAVSLARSLLLPPIRDYMEDAATAHEVKKIVEYGNIYWPSGIRSPAHQHWCSLLSLVALEVRTLPALEYVRKGAADFVVGCEDRLMSALEAPIDSAPRALTLGYLEELERTLFLFTSMSGILGEWGAALPQSPTAARCAAANLLTYITMPSAHPGFHVRCLPVSAEEQAMAEVFPAMPCRNGPDSWWFNVCSVGSGRDPTDDAGSDFSCRLAEHIYACAAQALAFLCLSLPEVSEEEIECLSPSWPDPEVLLDLQRQAMALSYDFPDSAVGKPRARRLAASLISILRFSGDLLDRICVACDSQHLDLVREATDRLHRV